jgi:hypothetical protein
LYALIIAGLATITLSTSSVRAEETTDQSSYPLKSENAIPPGDLSELLVLVLALRVKDRAAEDGKQCRGRNDGKGRDMFYGGARFYLLFLLYLRQGFRHNFSHGWIAHRMTAWVHAAV